MQELLTPRQMSEADRLAMQTVSGTDVMFAAGQAVSDLVRTHYPRHRVLVICGTGNNGGDGFVAAEELRRAGIHSQVALVGSADRLRGDAAWAFARWRGETVAADPGLLSEYDLVIDALFGAGLDRDVEGAAADLIVTINGTGKPVIAVDLPSGIDGNTGAGRGTAIRAVHTVTFFRYKPGHFLLPGRTHCGRVTLAQIGIPADILTQLPPVGMLNHPDQWQQDLPDLASHDHKYTRGHLGVLCGPPMMTGAARLAATAGLRIGAGLVTLAVSKPAAAIVGPAITSEMMVCLDQTGGFAGFAANPRLTALALGPGLPPDQGTRDQVLSALGTSHSIVLDAGALTAFKTQRQTLFDALASRHAATVLTPHLGELRALFPELAASDRSKLDIAVDAARAAQAVVIVKGADTVIAAPEGRCAINANAPPWLATAGSGDVLTGIIAGLMAQGMAGFSAACAGVWCHGETANHLGPGMISSDLLDVLPKIRTSLRSAAL